MNDFLSIVRNIKEKIFGRKPKITDEVSSSMVDTEDNSKNEVRDKHVSSHIEIVPNGPLFQLKSRKRDPYFIQIGFDFGTSYSKCICRDIMTDKAWVFIPERFSSLELPFLIPSLVIFQNGMLSVAKEQHVHYPVNGLYHIKNALVKVANKEFSNPILNPYKAALGETDSVKLTRFVENCAIFFLSVTFKEIRLHIAEKFSGFGSDPKDYIAVNLAIPIADAEDSKVENLFRKILHEAWAISEILSNTNPVDIHDLERRRCSLQDNIEISPNGPCYIYPEVSANVQGFVRSRVSSSGTYLFSDTGASTVDQSIFIFSRHGGSDCLTYLAGYVLLLGSGQIEYLAAQATGIIDWKTLESFRKLKEQGARNSEIADAKSKIRRALNQGSTKSLAAACMKLPVKKQLHGINVIFGGGGHCENPYLKGVMTSFSGNLFANPIEPDVISMPTPRDLQLNANETKWIKRLSVAYGLSFERSELAKFIYPKEIKNPSPADIWNPKRTFHEAPDKEQC